MGLESEGGWVNPPSFYENPQQPEPIRINDSDSEDSPMTEATLTTPAKPTTPSEAPAPPIKRSVPDLLKRPVPVSFGSDGDFEFEFKRRKNLRGSRYNLTPEATEMKLLKSALECVQEAYRIHPRHHSLVLAIQKAIRGEPIQEDSNPLEKKLDTIIARLEKTEKPTKAPTTKAPTTKPPTTKALTTKAPITKAPIVTAQEWEGQSGTWRIARPGIIDIKR